MLSSVVTGADPALQTRVSANAMRECVAHIRGILKSGANFDELPAAVASFERHSFHARGGVGRRDLMTRLGARNDREAADTALPPTHPTEPFFIVPPTIVDQAAQCGLQVAMDEALNALQANQDDRAKAHLAGIELYVEFHPTPYSTMRTIALREQRAAFDQAICETRQPIRAMALHLPAALDLTVFTGKGEFDGLMTIARLFLRDTIKAHTLVQEILNQSAGSDLNPLPAELVELRSRLEADKGLSLSGLRDSLVVPPRIADQLSNAIERFLTRQETEARARHTKWKSDQVNFEKLGDRVRQAGV